MKFKFEEGRENFSLRDYRQEFDETATSKKSKRYRAYNQAAHTREFEINLYWKRATYFWAFITTVYVAYYHVLVYIYCRQHGHLPTLVLSGLGLLFAVCWILVAKGSRHWQENWENHVCLLEDPVTGPLFKINDPKSISVSKVNLCVGYAVAVCAGGLFVFESACFCRCVFGEGSAYALALFAAICVLAPLGIVTLIFTVKGNRDPGGREFEFHKHSEKEVDESEEKS